MLFRSHSPPSLLPSPSLLIYISPSFLTYPSLSHPPLRFLLSLGMLPIAISAVTDRYMPRSHDNVSTDARAILTHVKEIKCVYTFSVPPIALRLDNSVRSCRVRAVSQPVCYCDGAITISLVRCICFLIRLG